jgi:hypothetical protein
MLHHKSKSPAYKTSLEEGVFRIPDEPEAQIGHAGGLTVKENNNRD